MDKKGLTEVDVDNRYCPSNRLREFVFKSFEVGSLSKAEELVRYTRSAFYKQLSTNPKFSVWYGKQINILSQGLMGKALKTLEEVMDNSESQGARISAVRTVFEHLGRIRGGGSAHDDREQPQPITIFNQQNNITISREDYTKAIEHAEAMGVSVKEIEEAKQLRDKEFPVENAGDNGAETPHEDVDGNNGDRFTCS